MTVKVGVSLSQEWLILSALGCFENSTTEG